MLMDPELEDYIFSKIDIYKLFKLFTISYLTIRIEHKKWQKIILRHLINDNNFDKHIKYINSYYHFDNYK